MHSHGKMGQCTLDGYVTHLDHVSVQSGPSSGIGVECTCPSVPPVAIVTFANGEIYMCNRKKQHFQMTM